MDGQVCETVTDWSRGDERISGMKEMNDMEHVATGNRARGKRCEMDQIQSGEQSFGDDSLLLYRKPVTMQTICSEGIVEQVLF